MKLNKLIGDLGLATLAIAGCLVAFTGAASANSVTLSQSGGVGPSSYAVSSSFTVTVFANLGPDGGGQSTIFVSLDYDPSVITATACLETPAGQVVGGAFYGPFTVNCGRGSPADGGLLTAVGLVHLIEQDSKEPGFVGGASGTLILGTVTFHASSPGTASIASTFTLTDGFLGNDFTVRTTGISLGSVSATVIPEPTTLALVGLGVLGLGLSSRLRRR